MKFLLTITLFPLVQRVQMRSAHVSSLKRAGRFLRANKDEDHVNDRIAFDALNWENEEKADIEIGRKDEWEDNHGEGGTSLLRYLKGRRKKKTLPKKVEIKKKKRQKREKEGKLKKPRRKKKPPQ